MMRKMFYLLPLAAVLAGVMLLNPWQPAKAQGMQLTATRDVVWKDFLGVNAHFLWFPPEQYRQQMQQWKALGLEWTRVDLHWDRHEPRQGQYRLGELDGVIGALDEEDLKSVFYLVGSAPHATTAPANSPTPDQYPPKDPVMFAKTMAMLAQRYATVDAWQVWNEPNLPSFWRPHEDAEGYGRLLLPSVQALRQVVPEKPVVMGGMAYFSQMPVKGGLMLEELGKLGVQRLGTVVAYHPYSQEPEYDEPGTNDFILRTQQLNATLRNAQVPAIWATEWGWSSYTGPKELQEIIGEQGQADYVLRRLALMSALDFDRIFLFALADLDSRATARDQHYGLLDLQGQPKPVYTALQRFLTISGPRLQPQQPPRLSTIPADLYSVAWQREDGRHLWMFWSASGAMLQLPELTQAELFDPLTGQQQTLQGANGLSVQAKPGLQMLVW